MNDRELLELAAKAAGIDAYWSVDGTIQMRPMFVVSAGGAMGTMPHEEEWNPLKHDSDAFRLMVRLGLLVGPGSDESWAQHYWGESMGWLTIKEKCDDDATAATRRAIVRAAAEIGRAMP